MADRYTGRLFPGPNGYRAICDQLPVSATGPTKEAAIEALREQLRAWLEETQPVDVEVQGWAG